MTPIERGLSHIEFWSLKRITEVTGISKSEVFRKIKAGAFPRSYPYRDIPTRRFWLSHEVKQWQQAQLLVPIPELETEGSDEFDALLK